jgi:hypothetical protein
VPRSLVALAVSAGLAVVTDETTHFRPGVFTPDESQGAVLSKMAGEYVIMLILQDTYTEYIRCITRNLGNIDLIAEKKKTGWIHGPVRGAGSAGSRGSNTGNSGWVIRIVGNDFAVQRVNIHDEGCSETNVLEEGSIKRCR